MFQGFEGMLQTKEARKRQKTTKGEERLFSLSSKSSPVVSGLKDNVLGERLQFYFYSSLEASDVYMASKRP